MPRKLKLLQVEDSVSDAELVLRQLTSHGFEVNSQRVQDEAAMRESLKAADWDVVISDFQMPGFNAHGALAVLQETGRDIPFLVVSGTIGEDVAVSLMKAGAHDYLMKDNLKRLGVAVERELRDAAMRAEHRQALLELKNSEDRLAMALQATGMGIFEHYLQKGVSYYSGITRGLLAMPADAVPSPAYFLELVNPEDRPRVAEAVKRAMAPGGDGRYAAEFRTKQLLDGSPRWISARGRVLFDEHRKPIRFLGVARDITNSKLAERNLQYQLQLNTCITEQSTDCILLAGRSNEVLLINPAVTRLLGYTLADLDSKTAHELMHHHYADGRPYPSAECELSRIVSEGGEVRDYEDVLVCRDGTMVDVSISAVPLELNGERIGTMFTFRDITGRKRIEKALRQSEQRFRRLFEADIIGITVSDGTNVLECNDHFLRILGYTREEFSAARVTVPEYNVPEFADLNKRADESIRATGVCPAFEKEYVRQDGTRVPVLVAAVYLSWPEQTHVMAFVVDLTERKKLEEQFRQAQKLESLGQLAGGVAHDFNNLLTVILGHSDAMLGSLSPDDPLREAADEIADAAHRAAALTRQLLQFGRQEVYVPKPLDVADLVRRLEKLVRRLIGEHVQVDLSLAADTGFILADASSIEQAIVNLAVNARDAMPDGGSLTIATSRIAIADPLRSISRSVPPGEYVGITVSDTGFGITPQVQARMFEPFFTTKETGKGAGLGLSAVYGAVKQSNGYITVKSTPGQGTTFRLLFSPADTPVSSPEPPPIPIPARGTETILVVEDEPGVRSFVRRTLDANGYRTLDCGRGAEALDIARQFDGPIHLLLTDVVMPEMSGPEVIVEFLALRPGTPVLCMSGYPERFGIPLNEGTPYIQKPFSKEVILSRIRALLDARSPAEAEDPVSSAKAVLVIEDSRPVRTIVARALRDAGYDVVEASDSDEGIAAFQAGQFSLVLSDLNLDGKISGLELLRRFSELRPEVKGVLMTGSTVAGQKTRLPFSVLAKPFDPQDIVDLAWELVGIPD